MVGVACEPQHACGGLGMTPCSQFTPSTFLWIPGGELKLPGLHGNASPGFVAPELCMFCLALYVLSDFPLEAH